MKQKKILRLINSLDPLHGGPSFATIYNSIALNKKGFKVDILTSDVKNLSFIKSQKIKIINKGPRIGRYNLNLKLFFWVYKNRHKYDFFIIHGIWQFQTLLARILLKGNYFVFVHGMLDPFFGNNSKKNLIKKIYKKIYWFLIEKKNLLSAQNVFLTSYNEKKLLDTTYVNTDGIKKEVIDYGTIRSSFDKKRVTTLFFKKFPKLKNKFFLLYLGRFHEKKGCEMLLRSIHKLNLKGVKIQILLAGPASDYKEYLKNLSINININDQITWTDTILNEIKLGAITASCGMILPSHGENFGVSIAESLSCSRPVFITNKVNIYKEIIKSNSGLVSSDTTNGIYKMLLKYSRIDKQTKSQMNKNALSCFIKNFDLNNSKNDLHKFLMKSNCLKNKC